MSFKDAKWSQRFSRMGDEAEGIFEQVVDQPFVRFGLERPPIKMGQLPEFLRYTPDYLLTDRLVEVQGVGRDRLVKLKCDKHAALLQWRTFHPVDLFVWDNVDRAFTSFPITDFPINDSELHSFPEGKPYFAIHVDALPNVWTIVEAD